MTLRAYLPSTLDEVRADGPLAPRTAYAVTARLRLDHPGEDEEDLEYLAYRDAAAASLGLLAASPQAPRRRVVLAADLEDGSFSLDSGPASGSRPDVARPAPGAGELTEEAPPGAPAEEPGPGEPATAVRLTGPVDWRAVVSLHVDDATAIPDVSAAVSGSPEAAGRLEEEELSWYDITERGTFAG